MSISQQVLRKYPLLQKVIHNPNYKFSSKNYDHLIYEVIQAEKEFHDNYRGREIGDLFDLINKIVTNNPAVKNSLISARASIHDPNVDFTPSQPSGEEIDFREEEAEDEEEDLNKPAPPPTRRFGKAPPHQQHSVSRNPSNLLNKKIDKIKEHIETQSSKGEIISPKVFNQLQELRQNTSIPMNLSNRTSDMLGTIELIKDKIKAQVPHHVDRKLVEKGAKVIDKANLLNNPIFEKASDNYEKFLDELNKNLELKPGTAISEQTSTKVKGSKLLRDLDRKYIKEIQDADQTVIYEKQLEKIGKRFDSAYQRHEAELQNLLASKKITPEQYNSKLEHIKNKLQQNAQETLVDKLHELKQKKKFEIETKYDPIRRRAKTIIESKAEEPFLKKGLTDSYKSQLKVIKEDTAEHLKEKITTASEQSGVTGKRLIRKATNIPLEQDIEKLAKQAELTKEQHNILGNLAGNINVRPNPNIAQQPTNANLMTQSLNVPQQTPPTTRRFGIAKGGEIERIEEKIKHQDELRKKIADMVANPSPATGIIERLSEFLTGGDYGKAKKAKDLEPLYRELVNSQQDTKASTQHLKDKATIKHLDQSNTIKRLHNQMTLQNLMSRFTNTGSNKETKKEEKEKFDRFYKIHGKKIENSTTGIKQLMHFVRAINKTRESLKNVSPGGILANLPNFLGLNITGNRGLLPRLLGSGSPEELEIYAKNLNALADAKANILTTAKQGNMSGRFLSLNRESKLSEKAGKEQGYKELALLENDALNDLKEELKASKRKLEEYQKRNPEDTTYEPIYQELLDVEKKIKEELENN